MLFLARHASENASRAPVSCPQSVESAVMRAFENAFNVAGCRFLRFRKCIRWSRRLFSAPLKMRSVHQKAVSGTEYPSRTVEACFLHRMLPMMRRVPQEAFLSTECQFRTVEACFWYGALPKTHRTWLSEAQASCCRCETSNFTKKEADLFSLFFVLNFFYNAEPPTRSRISEVIFC